MNLGLFFLGSGGTGTAVIAATVTVDENETAIIAASSTVNNSPSDSPIIVGETHQYDISVNVPASFVAVTDDTEVLVHNVLGVSQGDPYYAARIIGITNTVDTLNVNADIVDHGNNVVSATIVPDEANVDFTVSATVDNINALLTVPVQATLLDIDMPITVVGKVSSGQSPVFSVMADINSAGVLLTADIIAEDQIRYVPTNIDHNISDGEITIFANKWTMCFINRPVDDSSNIETISSFFIAGLIDQYGSDIHNKISMVVAKHPETGEEFNYVIQDGYSTPAGSLNDFPLCYRKDGVFYPIPFMVQSISDTDLTLNWATQP